MLLVTGITGHTGGYFLQELIDHKFSEPIRCVVRETSDTTMLDKSGLNIEKVYGDLNDETFIKNVMKDIKIIMHIYNIHHSPAIVEYALENNVERAILVHTTGVYSNFKNASREYKEVEEKILKITSSLNSPLKITILRPTMIYGDLCDSNMSKFIKLIDRFRLFPVINKGKNKLQPVNARDLGKAYYTTLIYPDITSGKIYNLSGEKPLGMIEVLQIISDYLDKKTIFISVPLGLGVFLARIAKILTLGKIDYVEKVQRMAEDRSYSHNAASIDFNYSPMSFHKGIQIEVEQYLKKRGKQ